jgi:hypothetical protein
LCTPAAYTESGYGGYFSWLEKEDGWLAAGVAETMRKSLFVRRVVVVVVSMRNSYPLPVQIRQEDG